MTNIKIGRSFIEIKGHSGYEKIGKDIVCASISTLSYSTINYLKLLGNELKIIDDNAYLRFELNKQNNITKNILKGFKEMVKDLEQQFPNYIKVEEIEYEEVR